MKGDFFFFFSINDIELETVVGGTVRLNTNKMGIWFSVLQEKYELQNCEDYEAMSLVTQMYGQYKNQGDVAYETAVRDAFAAKGWLK